MTIDPNLIQQLKGKMQDMAAQYLPQLLAMSTEDFKKWFDYATLGQHDEAYRMLLVAAGKDDLLAELDKQHAARVAQNDQNASNIETWRKAGEAVVTTLLGICLSAVAL